MEIGVVVHGPNIIDSLKLFYDEGVDIIFLLNYGKSSVTGHVFGYKVYNHFLDKIHENNTSIIQIERPGEEDGSVIVWNEDEDSLNLLNKSINEIAIEIAKIYNLNIVNPEEIYKTHFKNEDNSNKSKRIIHGVSPNENILVNGVVIGKSNSDNIALIANNGIITDIEGGSLKKHGVEKLGKINLDSAIIKTGLLRKSEVEPRVLLKEKNNNHLIFAFLDHAGEDVYKYKNADLVITIGDDTTLIASDILYRFNIPIIGITDGDLDKVVEKGFKTENSIVFELESGYDDLVGNEIFNKVFKKNNILKYSLENSKFYNIAAFKEDKIKKIKFDIIEIINKMNCKYKINII